MNIRFILPLMDETNDRLACLFQEFELIEKKELAPLQELIDRLTSINTPTTTPSANPTPDPSFPSTSGGAGYSH